MRQPQVQAEHRCRLFRQRRLLSQQGLYPLPVQVGPLRRLSPLHLLRSVAMLVQGSGPNFPPPALGVAPLVRLLLVQVPLVWVRVYPLVQPLPLQLLVLLAAVFYLLPPLV